MIVLEEIGLLELLLEERKVELIRYKFLDCLLS